MKFLIRINTEKESKFLQEKTPGVYEDEGISVQLDMIEKDGVCAYYVSASSKTCLSSTAAVEVIIPEIDGLEKYVSGSSTYRDYNCWYAPVFGTDIKELAPITQSVIYKTKDSFGAILCACDKMYKSEMTGCSEGISIGIFDNNKGEKEIPRTLAFLICEGNNPFELNDKCVRVGMELLGKKVRGREDRKYPEIFEYLGWCSWDAFQIRVSEENLLEKCKEFKDKKIPVKWAILDDMWEDCTDLDTCTYSNFDEMMKIMKASKLNNFEASPKRFPKGLGHAIKKINEYGIKVGIWHPTTGYWKGISPESELYKKYSHCLDKNTDGWYQPAFCENEYYDDFYAFLKDCGSEFLKVDNQSSFHFDRNMKPIGELASVLHKNIETAAKKYFNNDIINCMGLAVENMWNRPESAVTRCSDDFKPEDREWFKKHILQCTFNDLFIGSMMWCDFDMWWTDDAQANKNSLLRAVSGGPIYVSDTLGRSKKEILNPLVFDDGKILRCDRPAYPTADCMFENPINTQKPYKVQNMANASGIIAVYNLNEEKAAGTISPSDVYGLEGEEFAVYEHFSKSFCILKKDESIDIELNSIDDMALYVIVPLKDGFAPIGRTDKFISPKSIQSVCGKEITLVEKGPYAYVENNELVMVNN